MTVLRCSPQRPWGVHSIVFNDGDCPRCGWLAPGPIQDAMLDALESAEVRARADALGWEVIEGGGVPEEDGAIAA
jgi:hypothetical protein